MTTSLVLHNADTCSCHFDRLGQGCGALGKLLLASMVTDRLQQQSVASFSPKKHKKWNHFSLNNISFCNLYVCACCVTFCDIVLHLVEQILGRKLRRHVGTPSATSVCLSWQVYSLGMHVRLYKSLTQILFGLLFCKESPSCIFHERRLSQKWQ